MGKRTRKGVQESLHLFLYRSIIENCGVDLQREIHRKCIKKIMLSLYSLYVNLSFAL